MRSTPCGRYTYGMTTPPTPIGQTAMLAGARAMRTLDGDIDAIDTYGYLTKRDRTDSKSVNLPVKGTAFLVNRGTDNTVRCARSGCPSRIMAVASAKQGAVFVDDSGRYAHGAHRSSVGEGGDWDAVNVVLTCGDATCNSAVDVKGGANVRSDWYYSPVLVTASALVAGLFPRPAGDAATREAKARQRVRAAG